VHAGKDREVKSELFVSRGEQLHACAVSKQWTRYASNVSAKLRYEEPPDLTCQEGPHF
jgi:hypothetical protein